MDIELGLEMKANTELKKEIRLLKSLLYCTTRSCNNCGKVTCENFQRQRKDCCGNWVSYKDYIKELEAQIKVLEQNLEDTEICENGWKNRVKDLEAQIEKMKRCEICKHYRWNHCSYEINISEDCIQNKLKHFELKEIKEK